MFFILSKLLQFLLVPLNWIFILLIVRFFVHSIRLKKRLLIVASILFLFFSNAFIYQKIMLLWQQNVSELQPNKHYKIAVVLGGFSAFDKNDKGYFNTSGDRFIQTLKLYKQGIIDKIIISGGAGSIQQKEPPEADFVRKEFLANGVPDSVLLVENASRNTYENALFSKKIIDSLHIKSPIVVITSAFHSRRTKAVFSKLGIQTVIHPSAFSVIDYQFDVEDFIFPSAYILSEWPRLIKEIVGLVTYKISGKA